MLASTQINAFEFKGLERTNEDWLREYIDLELPAQISEENIEYIKDRLMNTRVFRSADVYVSDDKLVVDVAEKWTTIPVIRAEVGGGTPLIVAGVYDQHSFGRLITLGGEFRKYGNEKPGFVIWAKSPKHKAGRYSIGIEYWEDIRKRTFYDENGDEQANFTDRGRRLQGYQLFENIFLKDLFSNNDTRKTFNVKLGYNLELRQRDSSDFEIVDESFDEAAPEKGESIKASIQLITDDILVTGYELDGLKTFWEAGAQVDKKNTHSFYGFELFGYKMMRPFNLASHISLDTNQSTNAADLLFLGGFSSVRGLPDGIERGNNRYFVNLEARYTDLKFEYGEFQFITFADFGKAANSFEDLIDPPKASAGLGLRVASPHVQRLMLRLDYGWGLDGKFSGFSIGLNQFFQPYMPL